MKLFEASITRILRNIDNSVQFAIITAWRSVDTKNINKNNVEQMIFDIKSNNLSFIKIIGLGQEENGKVSKEPSLIIKNISRDGNSKIMKSFKNYIIGLGIKFNQYGIIVKNENNDIQFIALKDDEGNKIQPKIIETFKKIKVDKVATFLSKLKGHSFIFEYFHPDWGRLENFLHGIKKEIDWKKELASIV